MPDGNEKNRIVNFFPHTSDIESSMTMLPANSVAISSSHQSAEETDPLKSGNFEQQVILFQEVQQNNCDFFKRALISFSVLEYIGLSFIFLGACSEPS